MRVDKCDICGKIIKNNEKVVVGYKFPLATMDICLNCGKPIVTLLKKHKLIEEIKSK